MRSLNKVFAPKLLYYLPGILLVTLLLIWLGSGVTFHGAGIYPLRVLHHGLNGLFSPAFLVIVVIGIFYLLSMVLRRKSSRLSAILVLVAAASGCGYMSPAFDDGWGELDHADASGNRYYLAVYESASDGDFFYLYRCDRFGIFCGSSLIDEKSGFDSLWTREIGLAVEDDTVQIVNGQRILYQHSDNQD